MNEMNLLKFKLKSSELINVWQKFCESHTMLYDLTCEEYLHLLSSDLDKLESTLDEKNLLLNNINALDVHREEILGELNLLVDDKVDSISSLLQVIISNGDTNEAKQLESLNLLLLDIIGKIQEQNKKNQVFLNRAILSLQELKEGFSGKKNFKTYGANGMARANVSP